MRCFILVCVFKPLSVLLVKLHWSHLKVKFAAAKSAPGSGTVTATESVEVGAVTGTVEAAATGTVEEAAVAGSVEGAGAAGEGDTWEVALALAAWWQAARSRFRSLSRGPRWRGW